MADFDKIQPGSIKLDDIPAGTGQADDLLLYVDNVTKEIRKTKVQDLQINSQGDVYSVNGKRGVVTITADDLGALEKSGGVMTGALTVPNINVTAGLVNLTNGRLQFDSAGNTRIMSKTNAEFGLYESGKKLKVKDVDGTYHDVYTTGNKPTLAELGAKPASYVPTWAEVTGKPDKFPAENHTHPWDDILGNIPFAKIPTGTSSTTVAIGNHNHNSDYAPVNHRHDWGDINGKPAQATRWPTIAEVGLKPSDIPYGTFLGASDLNSITTPGFYHQNANANASSARHYPTAQAGSLLVQRAAGVTQMYITYAADANDIYVRSFYTNTGGWGRWIKLYSDYNKPTAAEVGALPTTGGTIGGAITVNGVVNANAGIAQDGHLVLNGKDTWLRTINSTGWYNFTFNGGMYMRDKTYVRTYNGKALQADGGVFDGSQRVYSPNNKPSAGDIGAAPVIHSHSWGQINGVPATATRWPTFAEVSGKPATFTPPASTSTVRGGFRHTWNATTKTLNIIPG